MVALPAYFRRLSAWHVAVLCIVAMALVVILDYVTGPFVSTSIFYLLPIAVAAWLINRRVGVAFSLLSAILWFATDFLTNPAVTTVGVSFWNAVVRLGFFLIVVLTLSALRQSQQRQEDLMSFVVHDLRAPLGNMLTALDLMNDMATSGGDSMLEELIGLGQSSGNRMMILVESLLDLPRLESGQLEVHTEPVRVMDLFVESVAQVSLTAEIKGVTITREAAVETAVLADRSLTLRILVNLLNNAIKFSPSSGVITLSAAPDENQRVLVAVQDQGPGIPAEWQQRVFAKYGQVSGGKSGGSGLGLTYCKLAVEAQNGRIWLESSGSSGTTLSFTLPAATLKTSNPTLIGEAS